MAQDGQELLRGLFEGANMNGAQVNIMTGDHAQAVYNGSTKAAAPDARQQEVIEQLKPIFFGVEEEARAILTSIQGMKGTQITAKVNQLVVEKKISDMSQHRELWKVLSDCGFYDKSESNWNQQVK
jgi:hypothetical protein